MPRPLRLTIFWGALAAAMGVAAAMQSRPLVWALLAGAAILWYPRKSLTD